MGGRDGPFRPDLPETVRELTGGDYIAKNSVVLGGLGVDFAIRAESVGFERTFL